MVLLSVNVNKVATLRNARGGSVPSLVRAVRTVVEAGAEGITVHPRSDQRHITTQDVFDVHAAVTALRAERAGATLEFNIEGDPRPDFLDLVEKVRPTQCTLVPVRPGELTSEAGWAPSESDRVEAAIVRLQRAGVRVAVFVDPTEHAIGWARDVGADRVELYTEPYARAFARGQGRGAFADYVRVAERARELDLGINAGHDLDLANLPLFATLPWLAEVSIGHALVSEAVFQGLAAVTARYLEVLADACEGRGGAGNGR